MQRWLSERRAALYAHIAVAAGRGAGSERVLGRMVLMVVRREVTRACVGLAETEENRGPGRLHPLQAAFTPRSLPAVGYCKTKHKDSVSILFFFHHVHINQRFRYHHENIG
jgi:hypothetical protein